MYITELQFLQREINFLQNLNETSREPSIENTIQLLKTSQNKLYAALVKHEVTAEEVHKIITENNEKKLVADIVKLQKSKESIEQQLSNSTLSAEKRQSQKKALTRKSQQYTDKWNEIINSPNKDELITKIEQTQTKSLQKSRTHDRPRDPEHTR